MMEGCVMEAAKTKPDAKVVAVDVAKRPFRRPVRPDGTSKGLEYCVVMDQIPGAPVIQMSAYDPHWTEPRHRHLEDEVLLLFDGELTIEDQLHTAPTAVYVPRGVLYGPLTAGPKGAKFFRIPYESGLFVPPYVPKN
jgi:hypothetical protein